MAEVLILQTKLSPSGPHALPKCPKYPKMLPLPAEEGRAQGTPWGLQERVMHAVDDVDNTVVDDQRVNSGSFFSSDEEHCQRIDEEGDQSGRKICKEQTFFLDHIHLLRREGT